MNIDERKLKGLVKKGIAVFNAPTTSVPTTMVVDGPLLGNGDFGATIGTEKDGFVYYFGKNDFWQQHHIFETQSEREDHLLSREERRTGSRIITVGWLKICVRDNETQTVNMRQDPFSAQVLSEFETENTKVVFHSWISDSQNTLFIELKNASLNDVVIDFTAMPGMYTTGEVNGYIDRVCDNSLWFEYGAQPYNKKGKRVVAASIMTSVIQT